MSLEKQPNPGPPLILPHHGDHWVSHFASVPLSNWWYSMGCEEPSAVEYALCLEAKADQWSDLFWKTVHDLRGTLTEGNQEVAPPFLNALTVPVCKFRLRTHEDLVKVCATIRHELQRFCADHALTQGILVTYTPLTSTDNLVRAEMCMGKKEIGELKQRMASRVMEGMLAMNTTDHLVILQEYPPTELRELPEKFDQDFFLGALCIEKGRHEEEGHCWG